jgi:hypothetical protein
MMGDTIAARALVEPAIALVASVELAPAEEMEINGEHHARMTTAEAAYWMSHSGLPRDQ